MAAKEDIITMDNGCVCCSVRGDLVRTFSMLVGRRKDFQAIIIETTGMADPGPVAFTFSSNALIADNFRIDSVVCLVDAKHINIHLDDVKPDGDINEAEHQVAFADRILLNKTDLVSKEELEEVKDRLKSINGFATVIQTERSRAPLDQVLGLNTFSLAKLEEIDPTLAEDDEEEVAHDHSHDHGGHCDDKGCTEDHDHGHSHEHGGHCDDKGCTEDHSHEHSHAHGHDHAHDGTDADAPVPKKKKKKHNLSLVSSVGFTIDGLLEVPLFNQFMSKLLQEKAADLYRTKGVLGFVGQDDKFVFQGVHEQINFGPSPSQWAEGEKRVSKMVFIGKNLEYEFLKESLLACTQDPKTAIVTMHKKNK